MSGQKGWGDPKEKKRDIHAKNYFSFSSSSSSSSIIGRFLIA
jgi:hypothetical protein